MPGACRSSRRSSGEGDAKAKKRRQEVNEEEDGEGVPAVPVQEEEDAAAPLFYLDRKESARVEEVEEDEEEEAEEEDEAVAIQTKRQKKQGEVQRRRQGQIAEADKDEEERALERLVFGARDTAVLFDDQEAAAHDGRRSQGRRAAAAAAKAVRAPAWQDEDDEAVRVDIAGKDRLRKLRRQPDEKDISGADYQERLRARFQESNKAALDWATLPVTPADDAAGGKRGRRRRWQGEGGGDTSEEEEEEGEEEEEEEDDDDFGGLFRSTAPLVLGVGGPGGGNKRLQPGTLEVVRCRDANMQEPSKAMVQAVQFHPSTGGLLFTAGLDKTLRFFQVDGKRNEKVAGVFFPDLPIQSAAFVDPSGGGGGGGFEQVVVSGRRPFFYWYDMVSGTTGRVHRLMGREEKSLERFVASPDGQWLAFTGKDGYIVLVGAKSKQWAGEFKMNGTARSMAFSADGTHLLASGGDAVVYRWDLRSTRCLARFHNEGGTVTSALAASSAGMTAVGAESGVVNLYEDSDVLGSEGGGEGGLALARHSSTALSPTKALTHLTTTVDSLAFNHDGQLLAMASKWNRDALRVVHVPSRTVYANWPTGQTPIRYPSAVAFSPNSGMLAVGNDRGRVLLYRLRHYDST